ncbi:serine-rich adhesin for platelets-like [Haliotis asinina]|uniref:serine-rich adhesin for platelets-like n=1 Tax=Haliotis asinina TaxID=109174 RepID=UPI0035326767
MDFLELLSQKSTTGQLKIAKLKFVNLREKRETMTDSELTKDPCDDYFTDDVSVISDTTHGTDDVTSPSAWAGLKGLMKSPPRKSECLHSTSNKGDCSPIIPSQNRTQNLNGDVEQDDGMSDVESVKSTSLLTVKGMLSRPRDTSPLTYNEDSNHRVKSLVLSKSDETNQPFSRDKKEHITYTDEQFHSFSIPTKSLEHSKQKAPKAHYSQILDEIFGSKTTLPQSGHNIPPAKDFERKGHSVSTQHSSTECLEISVSEKKNSVSASSSQLSDLLLSEKCAKPSPQQSQMTLKELTAHDSLVSLPTWENLYTNEQSVSQLTQEQLSFQQPPKSQVNEVGLSNHLEPMSKVTMGSLSVNQHPISKLPQVNLSTHQQPVSQQSQEELSTQLLDFIVEFTQESSASSGMGPSGSGPERLLESLPKDQHIFSPYEPVLKTESSEKVLLLNKETSTKSVKVADDQNNGPEIEKCLQDKQLDARSKNGKQNLTKFDPPMLSQKDAKSGPLTSNPDCDLAKMESVPWSSSKSTQGLQTITPDKSQFSANKFGDLHKQSSSGTGGDKRLTASANEKETLINLMARYEAMERTLQDIPDKSRFLVISTELKQIQGVVAQLNVQHKTERGRLSVRMGVKDLSKSSKKELKEDMQELGDRQKHLLQVVHRHKQINFRLKQVLACMGTTETGRESSKDTHEEVKTFPPSRLAAEVLTVQEVTDSSCRSPLIGEPSVSRTYKPDIVNRFHDITSAENGSASCEISFQKDNAPKVFQKDQNGVFKMYGATEAKTSSMTDYEDGKKECFDNDVDVINQYYREDMEQTQKIDISDSILISKSNPTCVEDNSVITATNSELLATANNCHVPCPQIKKTEFCVKSVHSAGAVASQMSGIEDSQQDLFSQGSSEQVEDRRMVEEIIATQALSHETDCPDSDIRHVDGRVRQGQEEWMWTEGGTDQRGLKKGEEGDAMDRGVEQRTDSQVEALVDREVVRRMGSEGEGQMIGGCKGKMDSGVEGRMDRGVGGGMDKQANRKTDSDFEERTRAETHKRIGKKVSRRIKTQNNQSIAIHSYDNTTGQGGVPVNIQKDDKLNKTKGADVREKKWNTSAPVNQMKRKAEDSNALSFEGQSECETKKIKISSAEQLVKSAEGDQAPCKPGISQSKSDKTNAEVMERATSHQKALSLGCRNLERGSIPSKIATDKKKGFVLSVKKTYNKEADESFIPISLKSKDGSLNKPQANIPENRNGSNVNTAGPPVGAEGNTNISMSSSKERSLFSAQKEMTCLSPPEQETEKIKDMSLMSPHHPHPLRDIATPQKLQSEKFSVSTFLSHGSTEAKELKRRMAETDTREKQSRKHDILLQKEVPSDYNAIPVGRIEDIQVGDEDEGRCLKKTHSVIPESKNVNNGNTTGHVHRQTLSNHDNCGTLSSAVGAEGSENISVSSSNIRSVCSNQKVMICLSSPDQGTEKVKDMSLVSPSYPHPLKNMTTPQNLQSENLPASKFLSPGSTVASSDVFPVSCRELVRRMSERDAKEKQSRKDNISLQKEAPSHYIAIPVGRIEDFCEDNKVKDVDDVNTQTSMFVQPQVSTVPKPVATSKMADLITLVEKGVLTPGKDVLSVRAKGKVFRAGLSSEGHIIGSGGQIFRTPKSWCQALSGAATVKTLQSFDMVLYQGEPLSSFVVRESPESSGNFPIGAKTKSQGKTVGSSISRSLKTANKSTSLPRQSSNISSTTTAANKVRNKSLTDSVTKSLSNRTGTGPTKTFSTSTANKQTGIPFPVPPNKNSVANRDLVAKRNKETSASGSSELMGVLNKCTIQLIDDAEIIHCPEIDSTFWMADFKDIRMSDSLWDSVDCWN